MAGIFMLQFCLAGLFAQECKTFFEVKQIDAQKSMIIKYDVPTGEIGATFGQAFGKLFGFLGGNNITPAGPPFAVYYSFDPNGNTVFEVGVPISDSIAGNSEISYKMYPVMKVVSGTYVGPFEAMEPFYTEMQSYLKDNGLVATGASWEVYLTDPMMVKDPKDNQAIVYMPVK